MKLGLLTDIHERVDYLSLALECFDKEHIDQIVVIGDVFEMGERIEETCALLAAVGAIGVWGNHDYGLCFEPDEQVLAKYPASVIEYMTSLRPRVDIAGCSFAHIEPWLDPSDLADLWYYEGPPRDQRGLDRIFSAVPNRLIFAGHYHRWLLATPDQVTTWSGHGPVCLSDGRHFVVVDALCEGNYAIFDTDTSTLTPVKEYR